MTTQQPPGFAQQNLEGRSVRDVVAYSPGEVNDAWCRKVLYKILKSLELQYAMAMPHRAITLDTVVFHANGEPLLISDDIDAAPAPDAHLAADLSALARVIHYAITHERAPAGPLDGRADGYSPAVIATVDACMAPDPALHPRSVDAVRDLLGMVAPGPVAGAVTLPASASQPVLIPAPAERAGTAPAVEAQHASMRRGTRWALAAGGGAIAVALALVIVPVLRDPGPNGRILQTLPQTGEGARAGLPATGGAAAVRAGVTSTNVDTAVTGKRTDNLAASSGASSGGATRSGGGVDQHDDRTHVTRKQASAAPPVNGEDTADARVAAPPGAVSGNASYQLQIKPWGVVYVDGVERGVSPPVKRLALTPGPHTIRITNPKYRDSILEFESAQTTSNGKIIVDFTDEAP